MNFEDRGLIEDIVDSANRAMSYVDGVTDAEFQSNQMRQDAVMYRLGVIGEAARFISAEMQDAVDLDWHAMRGMRHRLIHGYREVKVQIVLRTVREDLSIVVEKLGRFLRSTDS